MRKWAAASVIALSVILALPLAAAATGDGSGSASGAACPFPEGEGVVVKISDQLMLAWQEDRSMAGPVAIGLDPGTYAVELVSYDDHSNKSHQAQSREQWYLEGWDADGNVVFKTVATSDLAESLDVQTYAVGTAELTRAVVQVKAFHAAYPDPSEPHSVAPLCARFLLGGESSTSIVPSSTTSSSVAASTTSSSVAASTTSSSVAASTTSSSVASSTTSSSVAASTTSSSVASSTTSSSVASSTTSSSVASSTTSSTTISTSATAVTGTTASSTTTSSSTTSATGSLTTETVLSEALEGTTAQSLEELPLTGAQLEVAFVAIVAVMLGVLLVRRARSWQARLDRRAARIWRRPGN